MNQDVINSIEKLRPYTDSQIRAFQFAKSPSVYKLNINQHWSYEPHGIWHSLWQKDVLLYICNNLPFITNEKPHIFCESLDILIANGVIQPMLLFINKKFIKWSEVLILGDCKFTYIWFNDIDKYTADIDCVLLPLIVSYKENAAITDITDSTYFIFDSNNKFVETATDPMQKYTIVTFHKRNDLFYETFKLQENVKQQSSLDTKWKLDKNNVILFQDGLLYNGNIAMHGLNIFSVDNNIFNADIYAKIFYFKGNESKDNIQFIDNKNYLRSKILGAANVDNYINRLNIPFDVLFHNFWSYDQNITHALQCIMMYNSSLLDDVYINHSNIESKLYSGKHLKDLQDAKHNVTLSRKIGDSLENYPIIFLNGELYKYNFMTIYKNKDFIFPLDLAIQDNDIFEILYCKNIDNRVYKLFINSNNPSDSYYVNNVMDSDDIKIFSEDLPSSDYRISRTNKVEFEVDTDSEKIDNDHIKIIPKDPFYFDKDITLVSRKQFHHIYRKIKEDTIFIKLPEEFIYCNNPDNYLVFINHRKIDRENYKVTIPTNTRPFDDLSVFVNIPLFKDDEIEIFYLGYDMSELTTSPSIPLNGDIILDREKLGYGFNKYLYMVFINGKKVRSNDITNIDSHRVRINCDQKSVKNLTIIKHIPDVEEMSDIFKVNQDEMTNIMDSITTNEMNNLYSSTPLTDIENDIKAGKVDTKLVLYEIIRKYWMRSSNLEKGDPFVYDFEDAQLMAQDIDKNRLAPMDGQNKNYFKNDSIDN